MRSEATNGRLFVIAVGDTITVASLRPPRALAQSHLLFVELRGIPIVEQGCQVLGLQLNRRCSRFSLRGAVNRVELENPRLEVCEGQSGR